PPLSLRDALPIAVGRVERASGRRLPQLQRPVELADLPVHPLGDALGFLDRAVAVAAAARPAVHARRIVLERLDVRGNPFARRVHLLLRRSCSARDLADAAIGVIACECRSAERGRYGDEAGYAFQHSAPPTLGDRSTAAVGLPHRPCVGASRAIFRWPQGTGTREARAPVRRARRSPVACWSGSRGGGRSRGSASRAP